MIKYLMTKIRLQRKGRTHSPFYHIVVMDSRAARDCGKVIEKLGTYDPIKKVANRSDKVNLNKERLQYWLSTGAQPTEIVEILIKCVS